MGDQDIRAALDRHWAASEAGDDDAEDEIYHDDAVLEYPQSGERIRAGSPSGRRGGCFPTSTSPYGVCLATAIFGLPNMSLVMLGSRPTLSVSWSSGMGSLSRDAVLR
jgi:hypothetical protein